MDTVRFKFGQNWQEYSKFINNKNINDSIKGLKNLLPKSFKIEDKSFLHVGHKGNDKKKFHLKIY